MLAEQRHRMFADMYSPPKRDLAVHDAAFPRWVRKQMRAKRLVCFLVETSDGEVVGGGSLWLRDVQPYPGFPGGKIPYLMSMYTDPAYRGSGIATLVVKRAMAWSKARGFPSMSLHASRMGKPLYEKLGWERSSEMNVELR